MSVVRIPRKIKSFEYEGETYDLHRANGHQTAEITRLLSEWTRTIKKEIKEDIEMGIEKFTVAQGDLALFNKAQKYVAESLCFYHGTDDLVFGKGGENKIDEVDQDFLGAMWICHSGQNEAKEYKAFEMVPLFGEDFVQKNAIVPAQLIHDEIERLRDVNLDAAQKAQYTLNYRPLPKRDEAATIDPLAKTERTTTSGSAVTSSVSLSTLE